MIAEANAPNYDEQLRRIQVQIAETELKQKMVDLRPKEHEFQSRSGTWVSTFKNPVVIGAFIAGYSALVGSGLTYFSSYLSSKRQIEAEREKAEQQVKLEEKKFSSQLDIEKAKFSAQYDLDRSTHVLLLRTSDLCSTQAYLSDKDGRIRDHLQRMSDTPGSGVPATAGGFGSQQQPSCR